MLLMRATDAGGYYLNQAKTIVISLANGAGHHQRHRRASGGKRRHQHGG